MRVNKDIKNLANDLRKLEGHRGTQHLDETDQTRMMVWDCSEMIQRSGLPLPQLSFHWGIHPVVHLYGAVLIPCSLG